MLMLLFYFLLQFCRGLSVSGHKDWVRDVEVAREGRDLLLASCSQDASIRLWRICQQQQQDCKHKQQQEGEVEEELKLKGNTFCLSSGATVSVTLESVLIGRFEFQIRPMGIGFGVCHCRSRGLGVQCLLVAEKQLPWHRPIRLQLCR